MFNTVTIIGTGLIGGSMAIALREKKLAKKIIGCGNDEESLQQALSLGLIDEILTLEEGVAQADFIYIAIPVHAAVHVTAKVLDLVNDAQIVADAGSTKEKLCRAIADHSKRKNFVASHPMWGTEHSGPAAAVSGAFTGRACVICEPERTGENHLLQTESLYNQLGMHIVNMNAHDHDIHAAYVSHISHITSFALANTVLEKEREREAIFELAGGGFESTVRLAKSNPDMWAPIFLQNKENVLDVLNEHIHQLINFKTAIEEENNTALSALMQNANRIKRILPS